MLLTQNRNYRLVFSASVVSNLGDGVLALALPWLATVLTRDAMLVALVAMAQRLPWLLFALPAGVWTDRVDHRGLIWRADALRAVMAAGILMLALSATPDQALLIWPLALLAFLLGAVEVIRDNAAQTILPSVVASADLERANGQMWSAEKVTGEFIGPPLAGVLIGVGLAVPFGFDVLTFALSAVLIWLIAMPPRVLPVPQAFWPALREGIVWIKGQPVILTLALMLGAVNFLHMGAFTMLVLYSQEVLELGPAGHGLLLTVGAAGGVMGGLIAPAIATRLGMKASLLLALVGFGANYAILAVLPTIISAGVAMFVGAAASMLWNVVTVSYRQRIIPAGILGRVNSIYRFFGWGSMPFGALAGGLIVTWGEVGLGRDMALRLPFVVAATGMALVAVVAVARIPRKV
ncbi:MAG: MFS transporter [Pseudotabrizicola sp.]|uniref:MFS transporter n=1 Tax=Pseudotabrizicola sp. TaxID=2939647 RepID=UPI00272FC1AD|nr:MFS transporter [Pseudotabrizicola sp.]MDP2082441.1 MFS transporter [Pseudotabrizicola sp.]MDZ7574194.1 MFS transporter [Pseudotabrizicola sp.]